MIKISTLAGLLITGVLLACQMNPSDSDKLQAYIGMTASDFNSQAFVKARNAPLPTQGAAWAGYRGGMDLVTRLGDSEIDFPVSGRNGNVVHITAWGGVDGKLDELQLNSITFTLDPEAMPYDQAIEIASKYCQEAAQAGLNIPGSNFQDDYSEAAIRNDMNGSSKCSVRDDFQRFSVGIVSTNYRNPNSRFNILITLHPYF